MPERAEVHADGAVLRLLGLLLRPRLQLREQRRLVFLEQALLGRLQVRVAGAAEPDVELRIGLLGGDLGERFARPLERHRDLDSGLLLERHGGGVAPLGLHRTDDVELVLRACRRGEDAAAMAPAARMRRTTSKLLSAASVEPQAIGALFRQVESRGARAANAASAQVADAS